LYCWIGCCPVNKGSEVCSSLREKGFDKLVIMMTAKAQDVDKIGAYNFGVSDYITKPFNMDVLVAMIDSKIKFSLNNEKPNRTSLVIWSICPIPTC
jgi:two-component system alkaline phosphatase synthesis response regulator PhoP